MLTRATTLNEITRSLDPRPLYPEELGAFFVETADVRDGVCEKRGEIARYLMADDRAKVLVTGHPGSGKSTEIVKFQEEQKNSYIFISFSFIKEAQLSQAKVETLLVLIVEALVREVKKLGGELDEKTLESIYSWFSEAFEITEKDVAFGAEIGGGVDTKSSFLGKLLGLSCFLKSDIKTGSHTLNKSITKHNQRLSELAYHVDCLVREARIALKKARGLEMVLVIEDLDKIFPEPAEKIFIQNPTPLTDLSCRAVFTAPISLLSNPRASTLERVFSNVTIPMIKTEERSGASCDAGLNAIKSLLDKRMDVDALMEKDAWKLAIEKTAGVLRHLFDAITKASWAASQAFERGTRQDAKIIESDVRYGLDRLRSDLVRRIGPVGLPEDYKATDVTTKAMLERLWEIRQNPRCVESDPIILLLLEGHALLEYNGTRWHRVHPLVAEYIDETHAACGPPKKEA